MPNKLAPNRFQSIILKTIGVDRYVQDYEQRKKQAFDTQGQISSNYFRDMERAIWYKGRTEDLEWFYKTNHGNVVYHSFPFWRMVNTNIPRAHYGLPRAISKAMGSLLFSSKPVISIDSGSKKRNEDYEQKLYYISELNDLQSLLQTAARLQSYSGGVAIKLNYDSELSDLPLFTIYPKERYHENKKYGQVISIDFVDEYDDDFKLITTCGRGYIRYTLFKKDKEVDLSSHPETQGLKDVVFIDAENNLLNVMFAVSVPNVGNESDYEGLISSFHALDEVYSALVNYIRKTKPNVFISEDIAPKDVHGRVIPMNEFDNVITVLDGTPEGQETTITRDLVQIDVKGYADAFTETRQIILAKVGLSPATLGIDGAGANASGESLNIRERASGRTRNEKLAIWADKLNEFFYAVLVFEQITKEAEELEGGGTFLVKELPDFKVKIDFGQFSEKSEKEKIEMYKDAIDKKLMSIEFAVKKLWGDELSEDEILELVAQIKEENGMNKVEDQTMLKSEN